MLVVAYKEIPPICGLMLSLITTVPDTNVLVAIVYSKSVILGEFMSKNKFV